MDRSGANEALLARDPDLVATVLEGCDVVSLGCHGNGSLWRSWHITTVHRLMKSGPPFGEGASLSNRR